MQHKKDDIYLLASFVAPWLLVTWCSRRRWRTARCRCCCVDLQAERRTREMYSTFTVDFWNERLRWTTNSKAGRWLHCQWLKHRPEMCLHTSQPMWSPSLTVRSSSRPSCSTRAFGQRSTSACRWAGLAQQRRSEPWNRWGIVCCGYRTRCLKVKTNI